MGNKWDDMRDAEKDAAETLRAADLIANDIASLLRGRLRKVSSWNLKKLKREVRKFNIKTGRWMD